MHLFVLSFFLIFHPTPGQDLVKTQVTENITMPIPGEFRLMTDDEIASKYFTTTKPLVLYTNPDLTIDLGVNKSVTQWAAKDLEIMVSFQKSNIYNLYDDIQMLSEGTQEINGRQFAHLEFISTVKPDADSFRQEGNIQKYTYMQYVIIGQSTLVFNFTAPIELKETWQSTAHEIMQGVHIKGKLK
ncbi:hypothetical protein BFP72_03575 [Reichenbachiella sp. 5M10]|uniref:hypothetical protein n=1 Tax=Reichenbachiella sp. 5M10 TaxID=1889772 RepID=UPI000C15626F|nr:hypothetical protein [Reichenbachiella sp. 5M10]PIB34553.1 hypothetical protein BFP72_03575 [Reichenbachiella sp. 5M10]